jgi:hypothetical protein
MFGCP